MTDTIASPFGPAATSKPAKAKKKWKHTSARKKPLQRIVDTIKRLQALADSPETTPADKAKALLLAGELALKSMRQI